MSSFIKIISMSLCHRHVIKICPGNIFITSRFKSIHLFLQGGKEEEIMSPTISGVFTISYQTKVLVLFFIT